MKVAGVRTGAERDVGPIPLLSHGDDRIGQMSEAPPVAAGPLTSWRPAQRPFLASALVLAGGAAVYFTTRGLLLRVAHVVSDAPDARHITNAFIAAGAIAIAAL